MIRNVLSTTLKVILLSVLASVITLVISGVGIIILSGWWHSLLLASSLVSTAAILLFWDGKRSLLVEKGILGLLINLGILVALLANLI